jgi:hypothetical protein
MHRAWQSWLMRLSFMLEILVLIPTQKESIFLFCLCCIWIHICRVLLNSWALYVNIPVCWSIMLDPTRHIAKTLNHNMYVKRDHLKMYFKNILIQLTMFNKDRHTVKSMMSKIEKNGCMLCLNVVYKNFLTPCLSAKSYQLR